ncbi:MAG: LysR family transcriptional regulator [Novosphingobium sp.]
MIDFFTMKLFIMVAESGSLSRAADAANLAIGAISRRIALVEQDLGVQLLLRNSRGVTLTPAGNAFLAHSRRIVRDVDFVTSDLSDYARGLKGSVSIRACTSAVAQFLPADLVAFNKAHNDIRIDIEEHDSGRILDQISSGEAEIGVIVEEPRRYELDTWPYRRDRLVLVAPPHVLFGTQSVRFQDLCEMQFVQMGEHTANTRLLARTAQEQGWSLRLRATVNSYDTVCRMIQAGFGIGILPRDAARNFIVGMGLKLVELDEPWADRRMLLVGDSAKLASSARLLLDFLGNCADGPPHK